MLGLQWTQTASTVLFTILNIPLNTWLCGLQVNHERLRTTSENPTASPALSERHLPVKKWYYVVIVIVTFLALLVSAGVRTTPTVIIKPLETDFGWSRSAISFAVAVSLFTFGFGGPLGGTLIDRFGPRRIMLAGLGLIALGLAPLVGLT